MKTFRRPMFRKGGNVGSGVMTGIVDRGNYKFGDRVQEQDITDYISLVKGGDQAPTSDPVTDFLLQFGPNLLAARPTGKGLTGLLSTAGGAAKEPLQDLIKNKRTQRSENLALRAKAIDTLGVDDLKKVRAQAKMSVGPQLENETSEEYAARVENKMGEFIDSTYAKTPFLKTLLLVSLTTKLITSLAEGAPTAVSKTVKEPSLITNKVFSPALSVVKLTP